VKSIAAKPTVSKSIRKYWLLPRALKKTTEIRIADVNILALPNFFYLHQNSNNIYNNTMTLSKK